MKVPVHRCAHWYSRSDSDAHFYIAMKCSGTDYNLKFSRIFSSGHCNVHNETCQEEVENPLSLIEFKSLMIFLAVVLNSYIILREFENQGNRYACHGKFLSLDLSVRRSKLIAIIIRSRPTNHLRVILSVFDTLSRYFFYLKL